jgi:hypothetical protein
MAKISNEDCIVIKSLLITKHWGAKKIVKFYAAKQWSMASVNRLIKRIDSYKSFEHNAFVTVLPCQLT